MLGALTLLFVLIHTRPAKEIVRRALSRAISVEELDYQLWQGRVELRNVSVGSDVFELQVARILAHVSLGLSISVELESAELVLIDFFDTLS